MKTFLLNLFLLACISVPAFAAKAPWDEGGATFIVKIKEIEIGQSMVRVRADRHLHGTGDRYGCPENNDTFGWSINDPHHTIWLNFVTAAYLSKETVKIWQKTPSMCGHEVGIRIDMLGLSGQ